MRKTLMKFLLLANLVPVISPLTAYARSTQPVPAHGAIEISAESTSETTSDETEDEVLRPEDVEGAVIHEPVYPEAYKTIDPKTLAKRGEQRGYNPNTIVVDGYEIPYVDMRGNTGADEDYIALSEALDQNLCVYVGDQGMNTFFGHYYNLSDNGVFNPLNDVISFGEGSEVIITDEAGYSRGYEITQVMEFLHPDQKLQFYGDDYLPTLAYEGNGEDMVYVQYCRWDYALGLLISNIGYRVW